MKTRRRIGFGAKLVFGASNSVRSVTRSRCKTTERCRRAPNPDKLARLSQRANRFGGSSGSEAFGLRARAGLRREQWPLFCYYLLQFPHTNKLWKPLRRISLIMDTFPGAVCAEPSCQPSRAQEKQRQRQKQIPLSAGNTQHERDISASLLLTSH